MVLADGALKVAAGGLLAFGQVPALVGAGARRQPGADHDRRARVLERADPTRPEQQRVHFTKNVSMLGGLLLAAVDTEGRPSLAWRARRAPEAVEHAAADLRRDVLGTTSSYVRERLAG